jgi:glucokinase
LILNGQLYAGTNDLGGEVGHIRLAETGPVGFGKPGSFEGFCSGGGIAQLAKAIVSEKLQKGLYVDFCPDIENADFLTAKSVARAANAGDATALEIIKVSAENLGRGLAVLIDILNPECIVIGSIYSRNEGLFKPHVERVLAQEAIPAAIEVCQIKPALLGESIGDFAALCVAINNKHF